MRWIKRNLNCRTGEVHTLVVKMERQIDADESADRYYRPDCRSDYVQGVPVEIPNPRAGQLLGISMIHQELNLMPHLTIAQNIFIGVNPVI